MTSSSNSFNRREIAPKSVNQFEKICRDFQCQIINCSLIIDSFQALMCSKVVLCHSRLSSKPISRIYFYSKPYSYQNVLQELDLLSIFDSSIFGILLLSPDLTKNLKFSANCAMAHRKHFKQMNGIVGSGLHPSSINEFTL